MERVEKVARIEQMVAIAYRHGFERGRLCVEGYVQEISENYVKTGPGPVRELLSLLDAEREVVEVVCLCGSTRFADQHAIRRWELEQEGQGKVVVLMINYLPHWWAEEQGWDGNDHFGERTGTKEMLDELHLRKIDLSDRVEVINPGGYVGESTAREIAYAMKTGKPVTYMDPEINGPGVAILQRKEAEDGEA